MNNIIYKTFKKCSKCGGNLEVRSDAILSSYPVKYEAKCKDCSYIEYLSANDIVANIESETIKKEPHISSLTINGDNLVVSSLYSSPCIVCGDSVETLTSRTTAVICENCKQAIFKVRFGGLKAEIIDEISKRNRND